MFTCKSSNIYSSDASCDNPGHYICEYMPEIYLPAGDNGLTAAEGRARYAKNSNTIQKGELILESGPLLGWGRFFLLQKSRKEDEKHFYNYSDAKTFNYLYFFS
jgi:hypothetical protein